MSSSNYVSYTNVYYYLVINFLLYNFIYTYLFNPICNYWNIAAIYRCVFYRNIDYYLICNDLF